jgi:type II secretion system protein G
MLRDRVVKSVLLVSLVVATMLVLRSNLKAAPEPAKPPAASLPHVQVSAAPGGFLAFDSETGEVVKVAAEGGKSAVEWTGTLRKTAEGKWEFKAADQTGGGDAARLTAARADVSVLMTALNAYRLDNSKYPSTEEGLQALLVQPGGADNWKGPYVKEIPKDPWGNPYVYRSPGVKNPKSVDVWSFGPDRRDGGGDDLFAQ